MRALVTGATGFVGGHLIRRLAAQGDDAHAILRPGSDPARLGKARERVTVHIHDGGGASMAAIVAAARPDVVFHLAARYRPSHAADDLDPLVRSNLLFGLQLVDAMAGAGVTRLVNAGTFSQHFRDHAYSPAMLYDATKQAFEALLQYYVETAGLAVVTLKLFDTYGPGDTRSKLLPLLARTAAGGEKLAMSPGGQLLDLVHIDDAVEAFVLAAGRLLAGEVEGMESYPVSTGHALPLRDIVALYAEETGVALDIEWGGRPYRPREVMVPWTSTAWLPGWSPRIGLREGIRSTFGRHV